MLGIPASMFMNYKKSAGWKNFRSWGYWHTDDIEPTEILLSRRAIGRPGETLQLTPGFLPADATILKYTLVVDNPDGVIEVSAGEGAYDVKILKEGTARLTLYGNLKKVTVEVKGDNDYNGVDAVDAGTDAPARWFNLQGVEVAEPVPGQILIEVRGDKRAVRFSSDPTPPHFPSKAAHPPRCAAFRIIPAHGRCNIREPFSFYQHEQ